MVGYIEGDLAGGSNRLSDSYGIVYDGAIDITTWVSWYLESEKDDPGINDPEISELFDLLVSDPQDSEEKQHPLVSLCLNYVNNG